MKFAFGSALVLAAACLASSCASTPQPRYYTLDAVDGTALTDFTDGRVFVAPVGIPMEIDRPQMVISLAGTEVAFDDQHRWAAPLQPAITQALARDLGSALGAANIGTDLAREGDYRVDLQVLQFVSRLDREARIDARWEVRRENTIRSGTSSVQVPAHEGYEGLAAAHGAALGRVAAQIAAAVASLEIESETAIGGAP